MSDYKFFKEEFPAIDWFDVTPADGSDLSDVPRKVYVGGAGDLAIRSSEENVEAPTGTLYFRASSLLGSNDTVDITVYGVDLS